MSGLTKELALNNAFDPEFDEVAHRWLKGQRNPTQIAKEMKIARKEVIKHIDEFKEIARSDTDIKERAREALVEADASLQLIVDRLWETVEQADDAADLKTKTTALKNITDAQVKIVETLQKAGLYDDAALGDEMVALEEKQAALIKILKEVSLNCDNCRVEVARRLKKITNQVEPMVDDNNVYEGEVVPSV